MRKPLSEPDYYAQYAPPPKLERKHRQPFAVRFLIGIAFIAWIFGAGAASIFLMQALGVDIDKGPGVAAWLVTLLVLMFSPTLAWDHDREIPSLRAIPDNIRYFKESVRAFCVLILAGIGIIIASAVAVFILGGLLGLIIFGWRQLGFFQ